MLKSLLTKWNPDRQLLILLGDYVDRGSDSYGTVRLIRHLHKAYGIKALLGNHESDFLTWLDNADDYWFLKWREDESIVNYHEEAGMSESIYYYSNGGDKTINSFYGLNAAYRDFPTHHASFIKSSFPDEIAFLRGLPNYFEIDDLVCVHAGVNLGLPDWKSTDIRDFRSIRKPFHIGKNNTGKTFIFGHHLTRYLNDDGSDDVWVSPCKTKIGVDGGAVFGGKLHGLIIENYGFSVLSTDKTGAIETKHLF